jgi:hypothetical protein
VLLKLIACNVFTREVCLAISQSPHTVDLEFTEIGEHVTPERLRKVIQGRIDEAEESPKKYDAILLLFGLCGNATAGLKACRTTLVIPRAHDCCTILLGSKAAFEEHFRDSPSTPFSSVGYMERGEYFLRTADDQTELGIDQAYEAYVKEYGEENARYIWEAMHPGAREEGAKAVFINLPSINGARALAEFRSQAQERGLEFQVREGSLRLINDLVQGNWHEEGFLVVEPNAEIAAVYDWKEIVRAAKTGD